MPAKILVVDDNQFNLKLLKIKLHNDYYDVITAENGKDAVKKAIEENPDLILMDVMMPIMDGYEATRKIKIDPRTSNIPVILLTALTDTKDKIYGLKAGADDFLNKPIEYNKLFVRVKSLLRFKLVTDQLRIREETNAQLGQSYNTQKINVNNRNTVIIDDNIMQAENVSEILKSNDIDSVIISGGDILLKYSDACHNNNKNECNKEIYNELSRISRDSNCAEIDLIIINASLIGQDALRVCSNIRSSQISADIPILLLSEPDNDSVLMKALDLGVNDYIIFPIDDDELVVRASTQIKKKRYQSHLREYYIASLHNSVTDSLTGIYNRRYFDKHFSNLITHSLTNKKPLSIIMIDVDYFKTINDIYGHKRGDDALVSLVSTIKDNIRLTDLSARYGGDEFIIALPETNADDTMKLCKRIIEHFSNQRVNKHSEDESGDQFTCTISVGCTSLNENDSEDSLFQRADKNLYMAKKFGRNRIVDDNFTEINKLIDNH